MDKAPKEMENTMSAQNENIRKIIKENILEQKSTVTSEIYQKGLATDVSGQKKRSAS